MDIRLQEPDYPLNVVSSDWNVSVFSRAWQTASVKRTLAVDWIACTEGIITEVPTRLVSVNKSCAKQFRNKPPLFIIKPAMSSGTTKTGSASIKFAPRRRPLIFDLRQVHGDLFEMWRWIKIAPGAFPQIWQVPRLKSFIAQSNSILYIGIGSFGFVHQRTRFLNIQSTYLICTKCADCVPMHLLKLLRTHRLLSAWSQINYDTSHPDRYSPPVFPR